MNASALNWSFKANGNITHPSLQLLTSGAIGVVLGDIGTSPRYAFRAEPNPEAAGDIDVTPNLHPVAIRASTLLLRRSAVEAMGCVG